MMEPAYTYRAHCIAVYDGDTLTVDIDLGFGVWLKKQRIRLYGVNTPELRGSERDSGLAIRDQVRAMVLDKDVIVKTYKDRTGKYGRWLGTIIVDGVDLNESLIKQGFIAPWK